MPGPLGQHQDMNGREQTHHMCGRMDTRTRMHDCCGVHQHVNVCTHLYRTSAHTRVSVYMHTSPFAHVRPPFIPHPGWVLSSHPQRINCGKIIPNNGRVKKNLFGFVLKCCLAYGVFGNTFTFLGLARADVASCMSTSENLPDARPSARHYPDSLSTPHGSHEAGLAIPILQTRTLRQ